MRPLIRSPKDFWSGIIYLATASLGLVFGREYPVGSAGQMGPGYFPLVISSLLLVFGVLAVIRSLIVPGEAIARMALKPMILVVGSVLLFGLLIERAGFVITLAVTILVSAAASNQFRFDWKATLGLVAFIIASVLLFVKALGVPIPLFGNWFEGA